MVYESHVHTCPCVETLIFEINHDNPVLTKTEIELELPQLCLSMDNWSTNKISGLSANFSEFVTFHDYFQYFCHRGQSGKHPAHIPDPCPDSGMGSWSDVPPGLESWRLTVQVEVPAEPEPPEPAEETPSLQLL